MRSRNVLAAPVRRVNTALVVMSGDAYADALFEDCWAALTSDSIENFYPSFRAWYYGKVIPDVRLGRRQLSVVRSFDRVIALAIAKNDEKEKKICTIWVDPIARGRGNGARIIDQSLKFLGTDHPLITVPEEKNKYFLSLMQKYRFEKKQSIRGLYRPNAVEVIYNEQFKVSDESRN
ncbi:hypothetical protein Amal_03183 [Acetobacter malorum]|uniref:N-acetyltransferase domain-containing protein n=1 Tax=Acetobacter malorum TaxID=178901 RepID=A0A177G5L9_9PROT|nr:hypothetical protein [Acetobacter malorum]OAG75630.1 hypothetical protein Amal_03183 [Acetobacter malorum]